MMKNEYTSVATWRDEVSRTLGSLEKGIETIDKKLDTVCDTQGRHDDRIERLETAESNRSAVQKKMAALYAGIVAVVTFIANIAWKLIK